MPETKMEPRTPRTADPVPIKGHGLALKDRRNLAVTGVSRVISCDENAAVLETPLGNLTVGGQELQIGELSTQTGNPAAACWHACFADGPGPRGMGRAERCTVVPGAWLPAGGGAGHRAPCTGGRPGAVLFL